MDLLDELQDPKRFEEILQSYARYLAREVLLEPHLIHSGALRQAYAQWQIERKVFADHLLASRDRPIAMLGQPLNDVLTGLASGSNATPVKQLSHLKEMATLLPCLVRAKPFLFANGDYNDLRSGWPADDQRRATLGYLQAVPNEFLGWRFCFQTIYQFELLRNNKVGPLAPVLPPDLISDTLTALTWGELSSMAVFLSFKAIFARLDRQ